MGQIQIKELDSDLRHLRSRYTDATLLEDKLEAYVTEAKAIVNQGKRQTIKSINDYLNRVEKSPTLSNMIKFHTREQGHSIKANLEKQNVNDSESKSENLWKDLIEMKKEISIISVQSVEYITAQLDIFMGEYLSAN